jgi:hypothetical protein
MDEREFLDALIAGFVGAGLLLAVQGVKRPRPRVNVAVALPRGATADADLVEVFLAERDQVDDVRRRVTLGLPEGVRLVMLEDEWIGAPSLASRLAAVVYRADVEAGPEVARPVPAPPESDTPWVRVVDWDEEQGKGTLGIRFQVGPGGRLGRPADTIESLGLGLRLVRLARASVELAGE